jgi:hypothetical protein
LAEIRHAGTVFVIFMTAPESSATHVRPEFTGVLDIAVAGPQFAE